MAALCAVMGCSKEDSSTTSLNAPLPKPPPIISSPKKTANNEGGAAQWVGDAPAGEGWKLGPPTVGGKVGGK